MPAINVARTDTFEQQRLKINAIADNLFSISAGGSDLSTGILKIGDGTLTDPSLSFTNEATLGFYRPDNQTLGVVSSGKKLANFSNAAFVSFRDFIVQKNTVSSLVITNPGSGYDAGGFQNVPLLGGTGENLTANISVTEYTFTVNTLGSGYDYGDYSGQYLEGGNGTGAIIDFEVVGVRGSITNGGSAYLPGTYQNVPLVNVSGSGSGETATVTIAGTVDYQGSITNPGSGYTNNDYTGKTIFAANPTSTYAVTVVSNPGSPPPNNVYQIDGITQQALTLTVGNTYRFDISDTSMSGHPLVFQSSTGSQLDEKYFQVLTSSEYNFIDFIIKPDAPLDAIKYNCSIHDGMGATINLQSGTAGEYGHGMIADISVDVNGEVVSFTITDVGNDYEATNVVTSDIPGGSGFEYTLGTPIYSGIVTDITINDVGTGYTQGDQLTINDSDVGGKGGSGFAFEVTSIPGAVDNFSFVSKGENYQTNDTLILPDQTTGVSATVNGSVDLETNFTGGSTTVTIANGTTANVSQGMNVSGSTEFLGVTVSQVVNSTTLILSDSPTGDGTAVLTYATTDPASSIVVSSLTGIYPGMNITVSSGTAELFDGVSVESIDYDTNTITASDNSTLPGSAVLSFTPQYGANPSTDFSLNVGTLGVIEAVGVNNPGNGYVFQDLLNINPISLVAPVIYNVTNIDVQIVTFSTAVTDASIIIGDRFTSNDTDYYDVIYKKSSGGNIEYILIQESDFDDGSSITLERTTVSFDINTATSGYRYLINGQLEPSITMYSGDTYVFDISNDSNGGHVFAFSAFRDGKWGPSFIQGVDATTTVSSAQISVSSTTGILPGMQVILTSGQGIVSNTFVSSVDNSTTLTLTKPALSSGTVTLSFRGVEYTDGVERTDTRVTIRPTDSTPSTLYYYCNSSSDAHANEGGFDYDEVGITIDTNNPRTFGSGAELIVAEIQTVDAITADVETGNITLDSINSETAEISDIVGTTKITAPIIEATDRVKTSILEGASGNLNISSVSTNFSGSLSVGTGFSVSASSSNLLSSGEIKTTNSINVNDKIRIENNVLSTTSTDDLVFSAFSGRVVKITNNTALIIPSGSDQQRPTSLASNGAIRFNTTTKQYEGYSEDTSSWSSLGGVRDLDGNTTILAEESIGANDNTLWFINDDINSLKIKKDKLIFTNAKLIDSTNINAPIYTDWVANFAYNTVGVYVKYGNNIYEIVTAGTSATTGNPPTDTSGNTFTNGTTELRWTHLAVGPLTFNEISEIRIGSSSISNLPLLINGDLRLRKNVISTDISDIIIRPNSGKKVVVDSLTSLVIPVGGDNDRGVSNKGSIRFNTTAQQFEGYDGTNWGSLGGVKDVNQNTYIIPETSPGSDENILYFYNDNNNTLQLTTTALDFHTIDTVRSVNSDEFELTASLLTIDSAATTLDNTSLTNTFLHSAKQYFDIGISSGLTVDPVLRIDNQGDVFLNTGFGTGVFDGVKVFDKELKNLEISDLRIHSTDFQFTKGDIESGGFNLYNTTSERSAKVFVTAENITTGDKEFIEFSVIDDGTDVYFTEYGNITTGQNIIESSFVFTETDEARINIQLSSSVADTNNVNITIIAHSTKK